MKPELGALHKRKFLLVASHHQLKFSHNVKPGDRMPNKMFTEYLKERTLPECPGGGTYTIPPVGGIVECSMHGKLALSTEGAPSVDK